MKNLGLLALALMVGNVAMAADIQIFKDAKITTCGTELMGCASSLITSDGKSYLVDQSYASEFLKKHGHLTSKDSSTVQVREVMGVPAKETGHFPNPMAEFDVIKILKIIE